MENGGERRDEIEEDKSKWPLDGNIRYLCGGKIRGPREAT
jgi:hypothetical protein